MTVTFQGCMGRVVGVGGQGTRAPPIFGSSVNPISIRGTYYAQHKTTRPPSSGFLDLPTVLNYGRKMLNQSKTLI